MELDPHSVAWQVVYKYLIGAIVPRPIGWISTINETGQPNLAPFSFFNAVCANPPHVLFCPMVRSTDEEAKDTIKNVRETGEFVVNIVTASLAKPMVATSGEVPPEVDEFQVANLIAEPSRMVRPPRVAASPVHFECKVTHIVDIGDYPGSGSVVIGQVIHLHVSEAVLLDGDKIDLTKLEPIGRLAGTAYCRITDVFHMVRPPSQLGLD